MRYIRNKKTGNIIIQTPHLYQGQVIYLPINNYWEVVNYIRDASKVKAPYKGAKDD